MTEKARKIFDILGVEPDEEFKVSDNNFKYSFDHKLGLEFYDGSEWHKVENADMYRTIINGYSHIIKIPKPTEEDKIVIAYAKLRGFLYIAIDKDGEVRAYRRKPIKYKSEVWAVEDEFPSEDFNYIRLHYKVSFLSWEDEEPYYIGE